MAQDLTVNIKTTSDVPQAMQKAQAATSSFGKQVDDVGKKFSTAFKDIALSFVAPLVLLNSTISFISGAIAKAKQDAQDAMAFAEKGESKYLRPGTVASARELSARRQDALDRDMAKLGAEKLAREQGDVGAGTFSVSEAESAMGTYVAEGKGFFNTAGRFLNVLGMQVGLNDYSKDEEMQKVLERRASGRLDASPEEKARAEAAANAAAQKTSDDAAKAKGTTFKGPEGFSNVIGVGSNPVIEAMTVQLEESRKQTALLEIIASPSSGGGVPVDFTKLAEGRLTRSYMPE